MAEETIRKYRDLLEINIFEHFRHRGTIGNIYIYIYAVLIISLSLLRFLLVTLRQRKFPRVPIRFSYS